jgi:hypothetical protein
MFLSDYNEACIFIDSFSKKYSNIKFHENSSAWSRGVPCGQTDKHDEANSHFPNFAKAPKNSTKLQLSWVS